MSKYRVASLALDVTLTGCGLTNNGEQHAGCGYYQDSANVMLEASYQAINLHDYSQASAIRISNLQLDWANRVLEAPDDCFPKGDVSKAIKIKSMSQ